MNREAKVAFDICKNTPNGVAFCLKMVELGLTPIFEMTSPRCSIIVQYVADALTLLHVRENVSGCYLSELEINQLKCPFPLIETVSGKFEGFLNADNALTKCGFRWDLFKEAVEHTTGIEGWVIQFNDGNMVKVKTAWYQSLTHGGRDVTSLRWCDIARAVVEGTADDLKAEFTMAGQEIAPIINVEQEILAEVQAITDEVNRIASESVHMTPKDVALKNSKHHTFSLIMMSARGREFNAMEFFARYYISGRVEVVCER